VRDVREQPLKEVVKEAPKILERLREKGSEVPLAAFGSSI